MCGLRLTLGSDRQLWVGTHLTGRDAPGVWFLTAGEVVEGLIYEPLVPAG